MVAQYHAKTCFQKGQVAVGGYAGLAGRAVCGWRDVIQDTTKNPIVDSGQEIEEKNDT